MEMRWNDLDFVLAGGDESMTRMPFYDFGARSGYKLGNRALVDGTVVMLTDPFNDIHMGVTAENVAAKYGVSREEQDEFAADSQRRAATPEARAAFAEEIVAVEVGGTRPFTADTDEHPKPGTTVETLAALRPAFATDGTVTAGNASGGAIALGHPVGATGANLTLSVAKDMVRRDLEFGIVTMCIGGGQALAALFRRV
jgi:acetyl-CoA C-acetyltransferase